MSSSDPIAALEIGTTNTVLAIGEPQPNGHIRITAIEPVASAGVRKSQIVDMTQTTHTISGLLHRLADKSNYSIGQAYLIVSGTQIHTKVIKSQYVVDEGVVRDEHISEVNARAYETGLPAEYEPIELAPLGYSLDDVNGIDAPKGMSGKLLSLRSLCIYGSTARLTDARNAAATAHLEIIADQPYFAGTCAAEAVLTPRHKQNGALVIDLGGGTTSFTVWHTGHLVQAGVIGVGGDHVTGDIHTAFSISMRQAEQIKISDGCALVRANDGAPRITVPDPMPGSKAATISRRALDTVVNARLQELFTVVRDRLDQENNLHDLNAGVFLTGGGSSMPGIVELARTIFGCNAHIGSLVSEIEGLETHPHPAACAACAGLLLIVQQENNRPPTFFESFRKAVGGIFRK